MKLFITLILNILLLTPGFSQYNGTTFGYPGNKASVLQANHIQKEVVYLYNFDKKGIKDSLLKGVNFFNEHGDLVKKHDLDNDNKLRLTDENVYTYNQNNDIIKKVSISAWSARDDITDYEYNSLGNITAIYNYPSDTSRVSIENRDYDANGNIVRVTSTFNIDPPYISKKYSYYKDSTITVAQSYNNKGELQYKDIYEFDSASNSKSIYLENLKGRELKTVLVYDSQKKVIREFADFSDSPAFFTISGIISANNVKKISEHLYNPDGTLLETSIYIDGKKVQAYRHFYERF